MMSAAKIQQNKEWNVNRMIERQCSLSPHAESNRTEESIESSDASTSASRTRFNHLRHPRCCGMSKTAFQKVLRLTLRRHLRRRPRQSNYRWRHGLSFLITELSWKKQQSYDATDILWWKLVFTKSSNRMPAKKFEVFFHTHHVLNVPMPLLLCLKRTWGRMRLWRSVRFIFCWWY